MGRKKISLDIDEEYLERIDEIAKLAEVDRSRIFRNLLRNHIDDIEACYTAIHRIENAKTDDWHSIEDAEKILKQRRAAKKAGKDERRKTAAS